MRHTYSYQNRRLNPLRYLILVSALLVDLVCVFMIATALLFPIVFLYMGLVFLFFLGLRVWTIYMTYTISYSYYKGEFEVTKMYYRKLYTFIKFNKTDIKDIKLYNGEPVKAKKLYDKTCMYDEYLVELNNGELYILNLDDTMYAALTCEDKYDLFR